MDQTSTDTQGEVCMGLEDRALGPFLVEPGHHRSPAIGREAPLSLSVQRYP